MATELVRWCAGWGPSKVRVSDGAFHIENHVVGNALQAKHRFGGENSTWTNGTVK